jgi:hypothetical protein
MDEAAPVELSQGRSDADCEAKEASHLHRRADPPIEWLAAEILENQHRPTTVTHDLQWSHRPRAVEFVLQTTFVSKAIKAARSGLFRGGNHGNQGGPIAVIRLAPSSAEDALAILPQDREAAIPVNPNPRE